MDDEIGALGEPQKRLTTVHSRYHVGCGTCGFIEACSIKNQALLEAKRHFHDAETSVFDSMARHGNPECWRWNGSRFFINIRPLTTAIRDS